MAGPNLEPEHQPTTERAADASARSIGGSHNASTEPPSSGLPQFEFQHWPGQIAYLVLLFAILYLLMSRVFAPRIRMIFDEREKTIATAIASAKSVQSEAAFQAEAARQALADARAASQKTAADAKSKAQAEARARQDALEAELSKKLDAAEAGIRAARDAAMANVAAVGSETAQAIVEKLTGAPATGAQVSAAVAELQG
jgi:F-type H+-transporting ATPase subunit b